MVYFRRRRKTSCVISASFADIEYMLDLESPTGRFVYMNGIDRPVLQVRLDGWWRRPEDSDVAMLEAILVLSPKTQRNQG